MEKIGSSGKQLLLEDAPDNVALIFTIQDFDRTYKSIEEKDFIFIAKATYSLSSEFRPFICAISMKILIMN